MYFILLLLWIIFNARVTAEIIILGMGICALLYWFMCKFMGFSVAEDKRLYRKSFRFLRFIGILVLEISKSNMCVIKFLLLPKNDMTPVIVRFKSELKTDFARVLLANCITLTPGTYTVMLEGDTYTVHALDKSIAAGIENSIFVQQLIKLEG